MKKKLVSIILSAAMCMSLTASAGAAEFGSGAPAMMESSAETEPETAGEAFGNADEIFSSGEADMPNTEVPQTEEPQSAEPQNDVPEVEIPEQDFQDQVEEDVEDGFSTGLIEEDAEPAEAGSVVVKAENWEKDGENFKLRKPVVKTAARVEAAQVAEEQNLETEEVPAAEGFLATEEVPTAEETPVVEETPAEDAASGSVYYTAKDGIVYVATEYKNYVHKGYYLFDENGYLVTGKTTLEAEKADLSENAELFFTDEINAVLYAEFEGEEVTPYTSNLGRQIKNGWAWTGSVFCFYDEAGKHVTVSKLEEIQKQTGKYTGYHKINNEYYCLDENGKPRTGEIILTVGTSSAKYYFQPSRAEDDIPGKMYHDGWLKLKGAKGDRWLYYNQGVTNPEDIGKFLDRGTVATILDRETMGDFTYLIDGNGYIIKSRMRKASNGAYYCTDSRGVIYRDKLVKYKKHRYYFSSDGKKVPWKNVWRKCPGASNRYYYFGSKPGRVVEKKGWQRVTNTKGRFYGWFYFNSAGNHYMNKLTSSGYYFTKTGKLASGTQEINGKMYMFAPSDEKKHDGKMYKDTLIHYKKRWYYADPEGVLKKDGWVKVDGGFYYFNNYKALTHRFIKKDGVNGYLSSTGRYTTGWVHVSNSKNLVRYIDPDGDGFVNNSSKWIDGLLYYFDKNGYRITDLTNIYKGPYYFTVDRKNGVMTVYNKEKTVPVKTIRVSVGLWNTPTPTGTYTLTPYGRWQSLMGPSWGQYGTHVDGAGQGGIFIHSIACTYQNIHNVPRSAYERLGHPASHGCIRTCVADAKWVYEHGRGAKITIFDGTFKEDEAFKGPLGRHPLKPMKYPYNTDPTDPAA